MARVTNFKVLHEFDPSDYSKTGDCTVKIKIEDIFEGGDDEQIRSVVEDFKNELKREFK